MRVCGCGSAVGTVKGRAVCDPCKAKRKLERSARYRNANRERYRELQTAWRAGNKAKIRAHNQKNRAKHGDEIRARQRARYRQNKAKAQASQAAYYVANRERRISAARRWERENPERAIAAKNARRRNRYAKMRAAAGTHTPEDIAAILKAQRGRCAYCRCRLGQKYDVDHIVPVAKGGANDRRNLQITCRACNQSKQAKDPITFANQLGMLI